MPSPRTPQHRRKKDGNKEEPHQAELVAALLDKTRKGARTVGIKKAELNAAIAAARKRRAKK